MAEETDSNIDNPFLELINLTFSSTSEDSSFETNSKTITQKITSKESTLVALIEGLGPHLTNTSVQERVKAVDLLSHVFTTLSPDFLSEKELEFIVEFLCNRLKDQHLVIPKAILCVYPVVQCRNLPKGSGSRLLHQVFQEANVQSHVHKIRRTVFLTIDFLMKNRLDELKELGSDFVINFLQAIDGEKDPRNLLLLFQVMPSIISNFNLGPFLEDFFEVLSCYFPIDFSPATTMSGSVEITREILASALHSCLSHTTQFSPFLIPLALEKLDSTLHDAKMDSLRLLELCCEKCYQPGNLEPFLSQIWHCLRKEIFMGGDEAVEKQSVSFLQSAFKVVSRDEGVLNTCIDLIFIECKHHLCEPELRLIHPTSRILMGMCNASEKSCRVVAPRVFQVLHDQLTKTSIQGERKRIMEITEQILTACRNYPEVNLIELVEKWDEMLATWFSFIINDDPDFANLSLKILFQALGNEADFSQKDRALLQEHLLALLKGNSLSQAALDTTIKISVELVEKHGQEYAEISVPKLLETILKQSEQDKGKLSATVLAECTPYNEIVCEKVVSSLLTKVSTSENPQIHKCLNRIVEKVNGFKDCVKVTSLSSLLVEKLFVFDRVFEAVLDSSKIKNGLGQNIVKDRIVFNVCVNVLRNLMRSSSESVQNQLVERYWKNIVEDSAWDNCMANFPFPLVETILGAVRPSVKVHRLLEFAEYLLDKSLTMNSDAYQYQRLLSNILNKLDEDIEFEKLLSQVKTVLDRKLNVTSLDSISPAGDDKDTFPIEVDSPSSPDSKILDEQNEAIALLSWITKGLAMRGIKDLNTWIDRFINLLHSETLGMQASSGFDILLSDDEASLNPQSHCKYRFLYKQRLFQMSLPKLVTGYKSSKSNIAKANFITALSSQLKHISKEILAMEMESVFPLLVASLKLDTSGPVVLSTLKAFTEMLQNSDAETDKKLIEYCYDIAPQLVNLSGFAGNMEVRIMALQCLQKCAKCPPHVILPLRKKIIDDLLKCLDDPKRLVRKEAQFARNIWILVGSPGGL